MGIKKFRPTSPGIRHKTIHTFEEVTSSKPSKRLVVPLKRTGGRNSYGRITAWHRGQGHKRMYRMIDFRRDKKEIPAKVASIEYDPNRSARIALLHYADGEKRYILAPSELRVGDAVISSPTADIKPGNALPLRNIPAGTSIHSIELKVGKGGQLARTAGSYGQLVAKEGQYAHIRLPSGEVRLVHQDCYATIGQVSNLEHENVTIGKAGKNRWLGWRPVVRGVAMNPIDHPMGGGEGKSSGGRHPCTPWGVKERKTRKNKRTNRYILKRRD